MSSSQLVSAIETIGAVTSVLSDLATAAGAVGGLILAWRWLRRRDLERAHDAANRFYDELHLLLPNLVNFQLSVAQCMALMVAVENDDTFSRQKSEVERQCLDLTKKINQLKLQFFARYALVIRRGVKIKPEIHAVLESALITLCDEAGLGLQKLSARLISLTEHADYIHEIGVFRLSFTRIQKFSDEVNTAFSHVMEIDYRDYFTFPAMAF